MQVSNLGVLRSGAGGPPSCERHHDESGFNGPLFVVRNFATRVVPQPLSGERSPGGAGADYRGFAVLLVVAVTLNFRVTNGRSTSPAWTSVVATARESCAIAGSTAYTYVHEWWFVTIPCSRVG